VNLRIAAASGAAGKSTDQPPQDDGIGHAPARCWDPGFSTLYSWMGNGTLGADSRLQDRVKTSEFGLLAPATRTGENAWDKLLVYEPYQQGPLHYADGPGRPNRRLDQPASGGWWTGSGATACPNPMTLSAMPTSGYLVGGRPISTIFALMQAGYITTIQFGVGSNNPGANVYVNELTASFYRRETGTTFGSITNFVTPVVNNCLDLTTPCLTVPVFFDRVDTSPARGASVTIQLSCRTGDLRPRLRAAGHQLRPGAVAEQFRQHLPGVRQRRRLLHDRPGDPRQPLRCDRRRYPVLREGEAERPGDHRRHRDDQASTGVTVRNCSNAPLPGWPVRRPRSRLTGRRQWR